MLEIKRNQPFLSLTRNPINCHKSPVFASFFFLLCLQRREKVDGEAGEAAFAQRPNVLATIAANPTKKKMILLFVREVQASADGLVSDFFGVDEYVYTAFGSMEIICPALTLQLRITV